MVNSEARKQAARLVKDYKNGVITNDQFRDSWPQEKKIQDRALRAIDTMLWYTYSDLRSHNAEPSPELRDLFNRCRLFLETDLEYQWKRDNFTGPLLFLRLITFGISSFFEPEPIDPKPSQVVGPSAIWPFYTEADFKQCQRQPPGIEGDDILQK